MKAKTPTLKAINIPPVQVRLHDPDFLELSKAYGCNAIRPDSREAFTKALLESLSRNRPTLIELKQGSSRLQP